MKNGYSIIMTLQNIQGLGGEERRGSIQLLLISNWKCLISNWKCDSEVQKYFFSGKINLRSGSWGNAGGWENSGKHVHF